MDWGWKCGFQLSIDNLGFGIGNGEFKDLDWGLEIGIGIMISID